VSARYAGAVRRALVLLVLVAVGCATPRDASPSFTLDAARYADAFDATREVLRDFRFELERVDAQSGVVSTAPKPTAGLATPWDAEQTSLAGEVEDFTQSNARSVRVTFEPASPSAPAPSRSQAAPGPPPADLRRAEGELIVTVRVVVERTVRPGTRIDPRAIGLTSRAEDPELLARGMWPQFTVAVERDPGLEALLARSIQRRIDH